MKAALAALLVALVAGPGVADVHNTPVDFTHSCNANGAALTLSGGQKVYLSTSCDTFVPGYGAGRWWYAANGFWVEAPGYSMKFPGQDAPCGNLPYCKPPG